MLRSVNSDDVLALLGYLFVEHGSPGYIPSDTGPEFCAEDVWQWPRRLDV